MGIKDAASGSSEGREKHVIENWGIRCYTVTESLAVFSALQWRAELINNPGYLNISKQKVEGATWFFLDAYCKILEERNKLRGKLIKKKKKRLNDLRISRPPQMAKDAKIKRITLRKGCSRENAKGVTVLHLVN